MKDPADKRVLARDEPPTPDLARRVSEILDAGGLVALPTETVYGIAARADRPAALDALRELKGRPDDMPLTWHIGDADALDRMAAGQQARRLAQRYWPGPLTLVLPGVPSGLEAAASEGWTGVRFPAQRATAGLLAAAGGPVVMTSANHHAQEPCCSAERVLERFGDDDALELVVDGGPSRMCEASAVLKVGPGAFHLLRPGLFTIEELRAAAGLAIAFACTGNTCRSPMAEALARTALAARLEVAPERIGEFGFRVFSMGLAAGAGSPANPHGVAVLALQGIDLSQHRSRPALTGDITRADRVYGLTRAHVDALRMAMPPGRAAHVELLDPDGGDVPDPIGGSRDDYLRAARHIEGLVERRLDEWI